MQTPTPIAIKNKQNAQLVSGFTLIEVIVSAVLIAITLVGLANLFVAGKRHILHSRSRMTGSELGRAFLDPLGMDVREDQWGNNCLSAKVSCPSSQTIGNIAYTPNYSDITYLAGTTLRRVRLTISWNEPAQ